MTILYYDCFSGISGDMNLAALIDLGVPVDYLRQELKKLPVGGWEIEALPAQKKVFTEHRLMFAKFNQPLFQ